MPPTDSEPPLERIVRFLDAEFRKRGVDLDMDDLGDLALSIWELSGGVLPEPPVKEGPKLADAVGAVEPIEGYAEEKLESEYDLGSPYGVLCKAHGKVDIGEKNYHQQMNHPDERWYCPLCGRLATFDQDRYEHWFGGAEKGAK